MPSHAAYPALDTLQDSDVLLPRQPELKVPFEEKIKPARLGLPPDLLPEHIRPVLTPDQQHERRLAQNIVAWALQEDPERTRIHLNGLRSNPVAMADPRLSWLAVQPAEAGLIPPGFGFEIGQDGILGPFYIGHAAMVHRHPLTNVPWIIEANFTFDGIRAEPYEAWEARRRSARAHVWHARLTHEGGNDRTAEEAKAICDVAHRLRVINPKYAIFHTADNGVWPFGITALGNETFVYCSELIYIAAREGAGIDVAESTRHDWFVPFLPVLGPAQLSRSNCLRWLNVPGNEPYWS